MTGKEVDISFPALDINLAVHLFHRQISHGLLQILQGDPVPQSVEIHGHGTAHRMGRPVGIGGFHQKEAGNGAVLSVHGGLPGHPARGFPDFISFFNGSGETVRFHFHCRIDAGPLQQVFIFGNGYVHIHGALLPALRGKGGVGGKRRRKAGPQGPFSSCTSCGKRQKKGKGQGGSFPFHRDSSFS